MEIAKMYEEEEKHKMSSLLEGAQGDTCTVKPYGETSHLTGNVDPAIDSSRLSVCEPGPEL